MIRGQRRLAIRCDERCVSGMFHVHLLRSESHPTQTCVGFTTNLRARLATHQAGGSPHTAKFLPWSLRTCLAFSTEPQAPDLTADRSRIPARPSPPSDAGNTRPHGRKRAKPGVAHRAKQGDIDTC